MSKSPKKDEPTAIYINNKDGSKTKVADLKGLKINGREIHSLEDLQKSGLRFMASSTAPKDTPTSETLTTPTKTTASTALLAQTIQKIPREQTSIFEVLAQDQDNRVAIEESNIEEIGANLSATGYRALLGVLRACSTSGMYQRAKEATKANPSTNISEPINIKYSDYIRLTGETKSISKSKGWIDYTGATKRDAIKGLQELSKPVVQVYSIPATSGKRDKNGKPLRDAIRVIEPLITYKTYYTDLTEEQVQSLKEQGDGSKPYLAGKVKMIQITPSEIFYRSGFTDIPERLLGELEALYGKRGMTQTLYKMIVVLMLEAHRSKGDTTLKRRLDKFIANIGKYQRIETRQLKRAEQEINKELDKLRKAGAITKHRYLDSIAGRQIEIDISSEAFDTYKGPDGES